VTVNASGESHYVDLTAGRFHYRSWGQDVDVPSAVLVHGNGSTWTTWSRVAPALSATGMAVFALDLRGNGDSVRPPAGAYGLPAVAGDLHEFVDALGLRTPLLVGHCWGAAAALVLATGAYGDRTPPALSGLVLEEMPSDLAATRNQPVIQDFLRMLKGPREYAEKWIDLVCRDWHPMDRESLLESTCSADVSVYLSAIDDGAEAGPLFPLLARLTVPALALRGNPRRGGILSDPDWERVRRCLPAHSVAYDLAGCGHEVHRGDHAGFMRLVRSFLSSA
jgi:pimeloyl-ACP methyl ester carboxylesterase